MSFTSFTSSLPPPPSAQDLTRASIEAREQIEEERRQEIAEAEAVRQRLVEEAKEKADQTFREWFALFIEVLDETLVKASEKGDDSVSFAVTGFTDEHVTIHVGLLREYPLERLRFETLGFVSFLQERYEQYKVSSTKRLSLDGVLLQLSVEIGWS